MTSLLLPLALACLGAATAVGCAGNAPSDPPGNHERSGAVSGALTASPLIVIGDAIDAGLTEYSPRVLYDGTNYLAYWTDLRDGTQKVRGVRVSPAGQVLDATPHVLISDPLVNSTYPAAIASNGSGYLALWNSPSPIMPLEAARLDANLNVLDTTPITLTAAGNSTHGAVASDGTDYVVIYAGSGTETTDAGVVHGGAVVATRITAAGQVLDRGGIQLSGLYGDYIGLEVLWTGTAYQAVWGVSSSSGPIQATQVRPDGTTGAVQTWVTATYDFGGPFACSLLGFCLFTCGTTGTQFVDSNGKLLGAPVQLDNQTGGFVWDGRSFLSAWGDLEAQSIGPGPAFIQAAPLQVASGVVDANNGVQLASDGQGRSLAVFMSSTSGRVEGYLLTGDAPPDGGGWPAETLAPGSDAAADAGGDASALFDGGGSSGAASTSSGAGSGGASSGGTSSGAPDLDASASGDDAGATKGVSGSSGGCGCTLAGASGEGAPLAVLLGIVAGFVARRRRALEGTSATQRKPCAR